MIDLLQPIIKWSGSKRSQASKIVSLLNDTYEIYYEPFCGGCSVLFYILNYCPNRFSKYICSDINRELIDTFNMIKNNPQEIFNNYKIMWKELNKDNDLERKKNYFNKIREEFNKTKDAKLFFFIMRTTTNGMPRYNSNGEFNNSFHVTRKGINPSRLETILYQWNKLLNRFNVEFLHCSYDSIKPSKYDFMYLDPPYVNTRGMYYGTIDYDNLWRFLKNCDCDYFLSLDGIAGDEINIVDIPKELYNQHLLLYSGNSSFRRVIGKNTHVSVKESLYVKTNKPHKEQIKLF